MYERVKEAVSVSAGRESGVAGPGLRAPIDLRHIRASNCPWLYIAYPPMSTNSRSYLSSGWTKYRLFEPPRRVRHAESADGNVTSANPAPIASNSAQEAAAHSDSSRGLVGELSLSSMA